MLGLISGICARIFSNSYLNVLQKNLTNNGEASSVVNFYTYLGLTIIGFLVCPVPVFTVGILKYVIVMGLLGALGNYFIIKALSCGELSTLAPINSYKPIVAMVFGIFLLNEYPGISELVAVFLIILGTVILIGNKFTPSKAYLYRFLALIFSGTEAIFIKKIILMSDITSTFLYWAFAGLLFSVAISFRHKLTIKKENIKCQLLLVLMVALMQYSTNYVFSKMNVAYALALFQLSTILSVFLGVNIFKEKGLFRKLVASFIMIAGAVIILL